MMARARIVCFGEVLLRLGAPGRGQLLQQSLFEVHVGGAEANVATGLAYLGHDTAIVSVVADNSLGRSAIGELRRGGVDTSRVSLGEGRMGLYFLAPGAGMRPSEVIYDRAGSAFALACERDIDWGMALDGADWLHVSGITAALGPSGGWATRSAISAARERGVRVSFDCNYRARLWQAWEGDPRAVLCDLVRSVDLLFGDHRDIGLLLGKTYNGKEHRRTLAEEAFAAFPELDTIASTSRHIVNVDFHRISARIDTRRSHVQTDEVSVTGIVDRIGAGDAFAAGVLHGLIEGLSLNDTARAGLAMACLKHSLPGDAARLTRDDLAHFAERSFDVRR